jgi:hypothetical protein
MDAEADFQPGLPKPGMPLSQGILVGKGEWPVTRPYSHLLLPPLTWDGDLPPAGDSL